jgi:hypothetical protein
MGAVRAFYRSLCDSDIYGSEEEDDETRSLRVQYCVHDSSPLFSYKCCYSSKNTPTRRFHALRTAVQCARTSTVRGEADQEARDEQ